MKTIIASAVCLLVGFVMGCYIGYNYNEKHVTNEAVEQMLQGMESSERLEAAYAIRAIGLIESGETQKAVQSLSRPIADYYYFHADLAHDDERAKQLLVGIEQLASTNRIVADEITNEIHHKIQ